MGGMYNRVLLPNDVLSSILEVSRGQDRGSPKVRMVTMQQDGAAWTGYKRRAAKSTRTRRRQHGRQQELLEVYN